MTVKSPRAILAIVLLFSVALSVAQPAHAADDLTQPGDHTLDLTVGAYTRHSVIHIPANYDGKAAVPLLLFLHGAGGNAENGDKQTNWSAKADKETFIVAYPEALAVKPKHESNFLTNPNVWNDGSGRGMQIRKDVDDIAYLKVLLDELETRLKVNVNRVYVTGFSNGASMTFNVAAKLSDRITAAAPVSGQFYPDPDVKLAHPIPLLFIIGTEDPLNPLEGGRVKMPWGNVEDKEPIGNSITAWATLLACPDKPTAKAGNAGVSDQFWSPCAGGSQLEYIQIEGMGHIWAGGRSMLPASIVGKYSAAINASDVIWNFFSNYTGKIGM